MAHFLPSYSSYFFTTLLLLVSCDSYKQIFMLRDGQGKSHSENENHINYFKAGRHTYGSWKSRQRDDFNDNFDNMSRKPMEAARDSLNVNRKTPDFVNSETGFMEKFYNAIFFYGLEDLAPSKKESLSKNLSVPRKSIFFTPAEMIGTSLLDRLQTIDARRRSSMEQDYDDNDQKTPIMTVMELDQRLKDLSEELELLEVSIASCESDEASVQELEELLDRRMKLMDAIEYLQIEYVNVRSGEN